MARPSLLRRYVLGWALLLAANAPLYGIAFPFAELHAVGTGDARTHAVVVRAIAEGHATHGWTEALLGGFPLGPHYPMLGWGLAALLVKLGLAPQAAVDTLGLLATLAPPLLVFTLALSAGVRFAPALLGGLFLAWLAPANSFTGGYEVFYTQGLLSQALAVPIVIVLADRVARGGAAWQVTLPAVLAASCHPQVLVGAFAVVLVPVIASRSAAVAWRFGRACLAGGLVAAALYGPGIVTLNIPFGWPPMAPWKLTGFGVDRLAPWLLDGGLFDGRRHSVLTVAWALALAVGVMRIRHTRARAAFLASVLALALSVSGGAVHHLGQAGAFLLSFLQPLRILCLVPVAAATLVVVAFDDLVEVAGRLLASAGPPAVLRMARRACVRPLGLALPALVVAGVALPERVRWTGEWRASLASVHEAAAACASPRTPGGAGTPDRPWWTTLAQGRLWYDEPSLQGRTCALGTGFELGTSVPLAATGAVGTHVGVHAVAFRELHPERPGSARRAEALGIRHALVDGSVPLDEDWEVVAENSPMRLVRRRVGTDLVGLGCVTTALSGREADVREELFRLLETEQGASHLLDPSRLVALRTGGGPVVEQRVPTAGCDATAARVTEVPREAGRYEALVEGPAPADVVIRAAAFPSRKVTVDGDDVVAGRTAVGFLVARVPAGIHRVEAVVSPLPHYLLGVLAALLGAIACSLPVALLRRRAGRATRHSAAGPLAG